MLKRMINLRPVQICPSGQPLAAGDPSHHHDIADTERKIARHFLQDDGDVPRRFTRRHLPDIPPINGNATRKRSHAPVKAAQERCLARTIWTDNGQAIAGSEIEGHILDQKQVLSWSPVKAGNTQARSDRVTAHDLLPSCSRQGSECGRGSCGRGASGARTGATCRRDARRKAWRNRQAPSHRHRC